MVTELSKVLNLVTLMYSDVGVSAIPPRGKARRIEVKSRCSLLYARYRIALLLQISSSLQMF